MWVIMPLFIDYFICPGNVWDQQLRLCNKFRVYAIDGSEPASAVLFRNMAFFQSILMKFNVLRQARVFFEFDHSSILTKGIDDEATAIMNSTSLNIVAHH